MMLQLEQNLKNDVSGIYKDEVLGKLNQTASEVRFELSQGVDPEQYDKLSRFLKAIESGMEVVEEVWAQK
ncbi:MAG: EscE/YscE/SsaE family type III secretion system needle protein co-chaperone [Thiothrix sp.]|nr:EscE/YscE/SsaE family type III secretion system needle protein co-chaperone [Thiothrix sp.]HPQ93992.1 EscE/YscE/SsaE family type III secretion system needle protein co-chaperone [Thiolinea sp.]